jgi:glyoxylase I family protein
VIARGMSHVSFPVRDLPRALAFYRDLLGFAEIPRPDLGIPGAWLRAGDADVHLIAGVEGLPLGAPPPVLNPAAHHVAFRIDDYEAAAARLRESGLDVLESGPAAGQMWVQDPDGHVIELIAVTR